MCNHFFTAPFFLTWMTCCYGNNSDGVRVCAQKYISHRDYCWYLNCHLLKLHPHPMRLPGGKKNQHLRGVISTNTSCLLRVAPRVTQQTRWDLCCVSVRRVQPFNKQWVSVNQPLYRVTVQSRTLKSAELFCIPSKKTNKQPTMFPIWRYSQNMLSFCREIKYSTLMWLKYIPLHLFRST